MNGVTRAFTRSGGVAGLFVKEYVDHLSALLRALDAEAVSRLIDTLELARERSATIFFAGNGGSASTCSHFANDLGKAASVAGRPGFRVVSLTDNVALLTALANDEGYDAIFTGQMRHLFTKHDVLVVISAAGNSPNVVQAAHLARERGGSVVALVGFDGGVLSRIADVVVHVATEKGEYGPVEDIHLVLNHIASAYLLERARADVAAARPSPR